MTDEKQAPKEQEAPKIQRVPWKEFLESYPLNTGQFVGGYYRKTEDRYNPYERLAPRLRLYCSGCKGERNFDGTWRYQRDFSDNTRVWDFLIYTCKDCEQGNKTFCVNSFATDNEGNGWALKIGEFPEAHVDVPESLSTLLDTHYPLFLKGLGCEKRGFGIGAFTYYRRVVDSQKSKLIAEMLRVAEKLNAPSEMRERLRRAASENQFSRAIETIKGAIPESLMVNGRNPLQLLHSALSIGVHAETDENCLKFAHDVRLVLADFSERLVLALREQSDLQAAVSDLLKFNASAKEKAKEPSQ